MTLPGFKELLPNGIGFIGQDGSTVYYGSDYAARAGVQETTTQFRERCEREITEKTALPKTFQLVRHDPEKAGPLPPIRKSDYSCKACLRVGRWTRHHLIPRQAGGAGNMIRLCQPCHVVIHYLDNAFIAAMNESAQISFIRLMIPEMWPMGLRSNLHFYLKNLVSR